MDRKLTRRDFLVTTGATGAAALLVACGATATPVPQATVAPTVAPTQAPTEAPAQATQAPTEAPQAPEPTATTAPVATDTPPAETAATGASFSFPFGTDIGTFDHAFFTHMLEDYAQGLILSNLVRFKPGSYELVNDLADTIEQSDDGLTVSFTLKQGVKWHRGYGEVTAEDVKFSYERLAGDDTASPYQGDWSSLDHVEVTDTYSGKIIFKEPYAPLWTTTMPTSSGRVLCKKYVEEVGSDKWGITNPIGSGPYVLEQWRPKELLIFKRNPDYFDKVAFDEIRFVFVADTNATQVALDAGELDIAQIDVEILPQYEGKAGYEAATFPSLGYSWIGMNIENPKLQDIRVRQAIRYALDVPSMLAAEGLSAEDQAFSLIPRGLLGYWADAPHYERDVEKAKSLLAEAGVTSLGLRYDCIAAAGGGNPTGEVAQANLAEAGINVTINAMDASSYWTVGEGERAKGLELFSAGYYTQPDPAWCTMWFTCDQVGVWNWMRWCSEEFDSLHKQGMTTMDPAEREKIYIKMQQMWDEMCTSVFLTYGTGVWVWSDKIKTAFTPNGFALLHFFEPA